MIDMTRKITKRQLAQAINALTISVDNARSQLTGLRTDITKIQDILAEDYPEASRVGLSDAQINAKLAADLAAEDEPDIVKRIRKAQAKKPYSRINRVMIDDVVADEGTASLDDPVQRAAMQAHFESVDKLIRDDIRKALGAAQRFTDAYEIVFPTEEDLAQIDQLIDELIEQKEKA